MTTTAAIYEHGVLRPLAPLPLAEGARVEITVTDEAPQSGETATGACDLLRQVAGLPIESKGPPFSGRNHDRALYAGLDDKGVRQAGDFRELMARLEYVRAGRRFSRDEANER